MPNFDDIEVREISRFHVPGEVFTDAWQKVELSREQRLHSVFVGEGFYDGHGGSYDGAVMSAIGRKQPPYPTAATTQN